MAQDRHPIEPAPAISMAVALKRSVALLRPVWPLALLASGLGLAGGTVTVTLLAGINGAIGAAAAPGPQGLAWLAALALGAPAIAFLSEYCGTVLGQKVVADMRTTLCRRIASSPIDRVERLTSPRLMAVLTGDLDTVSATTLALAPMLAATATVAGGLGYLGWLAPDLFALAATTLAVAYVVTTLLRRAAIGRMDAARTAHEAMLSGFRAIVDGGKELRLDASRREIELDRRLAGAITSIAAHQVRTRSLFGLAEAVMACLIFAVAISVLALGGKTDAGTAGAFVVALLYLRGPLDQVVGVLPMLARSQIALRRIAALETDLGEPEPVAAVKMAAAFERLDFDAVEYRYPGSERSAVSPLSLSLRPSEIVFVTGANGAGKSTLIKLLTGLYQPSGGAVTLDGQPVVHGDAGYRGLFSTVFHDFHAFGDLVLPADLAPGEIDGLIARLGLGGKVTVEPDGRVRHAGLSTGQRRRLALLQVYLDRRPVVVLDEWAAEQDPTFRRFFYEVLLPELRDRGASIVLVTHDDRYFDCADRLLELTPTGLRETLPAAARRVA
jgi:putative ATP-binding cassette transporter